MNFQHLFTLQEIARLKGIIFHTFNDTLTGRLYRTSLELFIIELGLCHYNQNLTHTVTSTLTTDLLIQATMLFITQHNIVLKHEVAIKTRRVFDKVLMETFLFLEVPVSELIMCKHCWLYLKATLLSDITTGDGIYISDSAWNGLAAPYPHRDKSWPNYHKPPHAYWKILQKWVE